MKRQFDLPVSRKSNDCDILNNAVLFRLKITPKLQRRFKLRESKIYKIK